MFCPQCGTAAGDDDRFCRACGAAQHRAETVSPSSARSDDLRTAPAAGAFSPLSTAKLAAAVAAGFLLLITFGGIVAAVALPNFARAVDREKQRRTIADMRAMAAAIEAYAADAQAYPDAATIEELAGFLEPEYIRTMPRADGWGRPLKYESWLEDEEDEVPTLYALGSAGKDGAWDRRDLVDTPEGRTTGFNADIVLVNGEFVQVPAEMDPGRGGMRTDAPPPPSMEGSSSSSPLRS